MKRRETFTLKKIVNSVLTRKQYQEAIYGSEDKQMGLQDFINKCLWKGMQIALTSGNCIITVTFMIYLRFDRDFSSAGHGY